MTSPRMEKNVEIGDNAIIRCSGSIGEGVKIGNGVILEGAITVGAGTRIDHGTVVRGNVKIGRNNWIYPYCVIGGGPQHLTHREASIEDSIKGFSGIQIGDGNVIREFSTIHLPIHKRRTALGNDCYLMAYAHIAHDCQIYDRVVLANKTTLGGHSIIFSNANLGYGNNVHQFCKIGAHTMIGMGCNITKDVLPFALINRNKFTKINRIGMERSGIGRDEIDKIEAIYATGAWRRRRPAATEAADGPAWYAKEIARFVRISERGMYEPSFQA